MLELWQRTMKIATKVTPCRQLVGISPGSQVKNQLNAGGSHRLSPRRHNWRPTWGAFDQRCDDQDDDVLALDLLHLLLVLWLQAVTILMITAHGLLLNIVTLRREIDHPEVVWSLTTGFDSDAQSVRWNLNLTRSTPHQIDVGDDRATASTARTVRLSRSLKQSCPAVIRVSC